jgi:integrase
MRAMITQDLVRNLRPEAKPYEVRDPRLKGFLLRVQPTGVMTYYAEYGRGKRKRIGPADALAPSQAFQVARTVLAGVVLGDDPAAARREAEAHTLRSFLAEVYGPWAVANLRTHRHTLARLRCAFPDLQGRKLRGINAWVYEKSRTARLKAGVDPVTVNRDLDDLRSALAKAVSWGLIEVHPLAGVKRARVRDNAVVRFLEADEERRLRAALDAREERARAERDSANAWRRERSYPMLPDLRAVAFVDHLKPLVLVSLNTGVRRGELFSLEWRDVDLERANLTVRGQSAKSGRTRHIPLNAEALAVLRGWRDQRAELAGLIFPGRGGDRLNNVHKAWVGVLAGARVENFRWHDLRHTFASRLVMAGVDLNTVRELLGHSGYAMTLRYAHLAPEHKAAAVAKLVRAG